MISFSFRDTDEAALFSVSRKDRRCIDAKLLFRGWFFENSVYISNTNPYFTFAYIDNDGAHTSTVFYDKKKTAYGASAVYLMPSNVLSLTATLYFDVLKNTNDTLTELSFCGDYAHAGYSVTTTQAANHFINSSGIHFNDDIDDYYDETPCCYGNITGISW